MISKKKKKSFLAIDIGSFAIKFIETEHFENKIFIKNFGYSIIEPDTFVDGFLISQNNVINNLKTLINEFQISTKNTATSIPGNKVIIKRIKIPTGEFTPENIEEKIIQQAEQTIPYNINDIRLSYDIINPNFEEQEEIDVFLVASKIEIIHDYKIILEECKLTPFIADIDFLCLQNIFEFNYSNEDNLKNKVISILNIGYTFSNFLIVQNNEGIFYRDFNVGSSIITKNLEKKLKISFKEAEKMKMNNVNNFILKEEKKNFFNEIKKELSKSIELFLNSTNFDKIDFLFLAGGGSMIKGLKQFLESNFSASEINYLDSFKNFNIDKEKIDSEYLKFISPMFAVCAGLSIRGDEID